jgi:hypothetical protein
MNFSVCENWQTFTRARLDTVVIGMSFHEFMVKIKGGFQC